jgi:hypothetical protein
MMQVSQPQTLILQITAHHSILIFVLGLRREIPTFLRLTH